MWCCKLNLLNSFTGCRLIALHYTVKLRRVVQYEVLHALILCVYGDQTCVAGTGELMIFKDFLGEEVYLIWFSAFKYDVQKLTKTV